MKWKGMKKNNFKIFLPFFVWELRVLMEGIESPFPYLRVWMRGNGMGRTEHSFFSIPLKSQIFILSEIGRNGIRFNDFFTKTPKIPLYINPLF